MRSTEVNSMLGGLVLCHATFLGDICVNVGVCSGVLVAFLGGGYVAPYLRFLERGLGNLPDCSFGAT